MNTHIIKHLKVPIFDKMKNLHLDISSLSKHAHSSSNKLRDIEEQLDQKIAQVLQEIKGWIMEEGKFDITKHDNQKAHFGIYMIEKKTPRTIIPILIVYPKQYSVPNTLIIGWGWKMYDIDIKALRAIKDNRIQKVIDALKRNCLRYNLDLNMSPEESFEGITIAKLIPVKGLTKSTFKNAIVELMAMWAFLMHLFEKYNMSRAGFNLSDYI